jgi:hypothetical protein
VLRTAARSVRVAAYAYGSVISRDGTPSSPDPLKVVAAVKTSEPRSLDLTTSRFQRCHVSPGQALDLSWQISIGVTPVALTGTRRTAHSRRWLLGLRWQPDSPSHGSLNRPSIVTLAKRHRFSIIGAIAARATAADSAATLNTPDNLWPGSPSNAEPSDWIRSDTVLLKPVCARNAHKPPRIPGPSVLPPRLPLPQHSELAPAYSEGRH